MKKVEQNKYKFEKRGMSRIKALFGNSGPLRFHSGVQIQQFLKQSNSMRKL